MTKEIHFQMSFTSRGSYLSKHVCPICAYAVISKANDHCFLRIVTAEDLIKEVLELGTPLRLVKIKHEDDVILRFRVLVIAWWEVRQGCPVVTNVIKS